MRRREGAGGQSSFEGFFRCRVGRVFLSLVGVAEDEKRPGLGYGHGLLLQLDVGERPRPRAHGHLWLVVVLVAWWTARRRRRMRHLAACWEQPTLDLTLVTYVIIGRIRVLLLALVSAVLVHVDLRREGVTSNIQPSRFLLLLRSVSAGSTLVAVLVSPSEVMDFSSIFSFFDSSMGGFSLLWRFSGLDNLKERWKNGNQPNIVWREVVNRGLNRLPTWLVSSSPSPLPPPSGQTSGSPHRQGCPQRWPRRHSEGCLFKRGGVKGGSRLLLGRMTN